MASSTATTDVPKVQRAWRVTQRGTPSQALILANDIPIPPRLPGEVLVKVEAAALNPVGYKLMELLPNAVAKRPHTAENDFAGVVVDSNGTEFKSGDEVFGVIETSLQQKTSQGALAQFICIPASRITLKPNNITFTEAAGAALAGITAWQGLVAIGGIKSGQSVFVNGGTSSVGSFAIQIAKAMGCKVTATASTTKYDLVKRLGADVVIDYSVVDPLNKHLEANPPSPPFDIIFDAIGVVALYSTSSNYLSPTGIYVSTGAQSPSEIAGTVLTKIRPSWLGGVKARHAVFLMDPQRKYLDEVAKLISEGKVKPLVDSEHAFSDVLKAYERIMSGRPSGKVVVHVD